MTNTDLHEELMKCYNHRTMVTRMNNCVNLSSLCDRSKYVVSVIDIFSFHFFQFSRDKESTSVSRLIRATKYDVWKPIAGAAPAPRRGLQRRRSALSLGSGNMNIISWSGQEQPIYAVRCSGGGFNVILATTPILNPISDV